MNQLSCADQFIATAVSWWLGQHVSSTMKWSAFYFLCLVMCNCQHTAGQEDSCYIDDIATQLVSYFIQDYLVNEVPEDHPGVSLQELAATRYFHLTDENGDSRIYLRKQVLKGGENNFARYLARAGEITASDACAIQFTTSCYVDSSEISLQNFLQCTSVISINSTKSCPAQTEETNSNCSYGCVYDNGCRDKLCCYDNRCKYKRCMEPNVTVISRQEDCPLNTAQTKAVEVQDRNVTFCIHQYECDADRQQHCCWQRNKKVCYEEPAQHREFSAGSTTTMQMPIVALLLVMARL